MIDSFTEDRVEKYHTGTLDVLNSFQTYIESGFFDDAQTILDVGCGDGKITAHLAKCYPDAQIIGCDVSDKMIEFASKKYPSGEYPNLHFEIKKRVST